MRYIIFISLFLFQLKAFATYYTLYDLFSNDSINLSTKDFGEMVNIPLIQSNEDIAFRFFGFANQNLENFKNEKILPQIKAKWREGSIRNKLIQEKLKVENNLKSKYNNSSNLNEFRLRSIELTPISYLGDFVTIEENLTYYYNSDLEYDSKVLVSYYYVNVATKKIYFEEDLWQEINYNSLKNNLLMKWSKIKDKLHSNNVRYDPKNDVIQAQKFYDHQNDSLSIFDSKVDSLIINSLKSQIHIAWTGSGLLVYFDEKFHYSKCSEGWFLEILLDYKELEGVFNRNSQIYTSLKKRKKLISAVNGFSLRYLDVNNIFTPFKSRTLLNLTKLKDESIKSIVYTNPTYSPSKKKLLYNSGKLIGIKSGTNYDWLNDKIVAVWNYSTNCKNCNNDIFTCYELIKEEFNYRGNIINRLDVDKDIYYTEFTYSKNLIFSTTYSPLSRYHSYYSDIYRSNNKKTCSLDHQLCILYNNRGLVYQHLQKKKIYDADNRLVQEINDDRNYTIYFYDKDDKVKRVLLNAEDNRKLISYDFHYERLEEVPFKIHVKTEKKEYDLLFDINR